VRGARQRERGSRGADAGACRAGAGASEKNPRSSFRLLPSPPRATACAVTRALTVRVALAAAPGMGFTREAAMDSGSARCWVEGSERRRGGGNRGVRRELGAPDPLAPPPPSFSSRKSARVQTHRGGGGIHHTAHTHTHAQPQTHTPRAHTANKHEGRVPLRAGARAGCFWTRVSGDDERETNTHTPLQSPPAPLFTRKRALHSLPALSQSP